MTLQGAIATNRFGLGARPGEIDDAGRGPQAWLEAQLTSESYKQFPMKGLLTSRAALELQQSHRAARRAALKNGQKADLKKANRQQRDLIKRERYARLQFGLITQASFHERLTRFWANHFTVSAQKQAVAMIVGPYEREAIRPNILGHFFDLAWNAITHPAMLIYLDNVASIGGRAAKRAKRKRGINENLAREIMELHTVTPAAGYTQKDVTEFAKALTGWTVGGIVPRISPAGETVFAEQLHEAGTRQVLNKRYADAGAGQVRTIIADLCRHPATAQNIAYKLARHFTADTPPVSLVDRLANVFRETDGNLMSLYKALIDAPECWIETPQKMKTPDEFITSVGRLVGIDPIVAANRPDALTLMGQTSYAAPSPEGWPDDTSAWLHSGAILRRVEWTHKLAGQITASMPRLVLQEGLGPLAAPKTVAAVERAESARQAITLAFMSPDFQRR